jgi:hypothetical protein
MYIAVQEVNKEMVVCLVEEFGADVNLVTERGLTPLMACVYTEAREDRPIPAEKWRERNAQASILEYGTAEEISRDFGASAEHIAYLESRQESIVETLTAMVQDSRSSQIAWMCSSARRIAKWYLGQCIRSTASGAWRRRLARRCEVAFPSWLYNSVSVAKLPGFDN